MRVPSSVVSASVVGPSETTRSGRPLGGPQNGPNRPGAFWDTKRLRFDTFVNRKCTEFCGLPIRRIWPPDTCPISTPSLAPPGPPKSTSGHACLSRLPAFEPSLCGQRLWHRQARADKVGRLATLLVRKGEDPRGSALRSVRRRLTIRSLCFRKLYI